MRIYEFCLVPLILVMLNQSIHLSCASVNQNNFGTSSFLWDDRHIVSLSSIYTFHRHSWWLYFRWLLFIKMSQSFPEIRNIHIVGGFHSIMHSFHQYPYFQDWREVRATNTCIVQSRSAILSLILIQVFGMQWFFFPKIYRNLTPTLNL